MKKQTESRPYGAYKKVPKKDVEFFELWTNEIIRLQQWILHNSKTAKRNDILYRSLKIKKLRSMCAHQNSYYRVKRLIP